MFRRRHEPTFINRVIGFFWPRAGFKRSTLYVGHRVARIKGSPYSIAAGFASGAAISFTPFVGLHFIFGALIAWIVRGNLLASAIGTVVGNPWTFPFIWIGIYKLGILLGAGDGTHNHDMDFLAFFDTLITAVKSLDWAYVGEVAWPVFWPMLLGSLPIFFLTWFLFFVPIRYMVNRYHDRRKSRRAGASAKYKRSTK